jgi:hypothetical protein
MTLGAIIQPAVAARAGSQDKFLRDVHSVLRITGPHIEWVPDGRGGSTPTLVYDVTNVTNRTVLIPVTVVSTRPANWAGSRQHWIERLGPDPTISAMPSGTARRGRQYAYGGEAIPWPAQVIAPGHFFRFRQPIGIGGFPSGQYAVTVEYATTHELKLIQTQVVTFNVP